MGFKSAALTAYNVAGTILGTWDPSYQNGTDASMSGEELARLVDLYNESLGINDILINKEGKRALFSQEGFDDYMGSRIADVGGFSAIIGSNGKSLREASQADRLNNCFTVTPETNEARKKFTEDMSNLLDYIEQKESSYRPKDLIDYLYNIKNDASNAIKAQQAQEIQRIEKLFSDDGFKALLKNDLSSNDDQLNKIKKEMLATLNKSHKEHLATFEKSMDEPLNKIHAAAQIERDRVAFLALI